VIHGLSKSTDYDDRGVYTSRSLGPFYGAIAVPSVTRCRCCRCCCGHRCAGGVRQLRHLVNGNAVANGPNIFQMLLVYRLQSFSNGMSRCWKISTDKRVARSRCHSRASCTATMQYEVLPPPHQPLPGNHREVVSSRRWRRLPR